jgi:hypothetical protein
MPNWVWNEKCTTRPKCPMCHATFINSLYFSNFFWEFFCLIISFLILFCTKKKKTIWKLFWEIDEFQDFTRFFHGTRF